MQNQKIIEQLGYSSKEAKVYLASLSLGESNISDIAHEVHMPRSTVQIIVNRLHEEGLMNFYIMRRSKYWIAEKPQQLLENLKKREVTIAKALPKLSAIRQASRGNKKSTVVHEKSISIYRDFSEASHLPILITNSSMEIVHVNVAWQKECGYKLNAVRGQNSRTFQSDKTTDAVHERMCKDLKFGRPSQSAEIIYKKKDGTNVNFHTTIIPSHHGGRTFYIHILAPASGKE